MYWTIQEIVASYKRSGEDREQIDIIAQCNGCTSEKIEEILEKQGCKINREKRRRRGRKKMEIPETEYKKTAKQARTEQEAQITEQEDQIAEQEEEQTETEEQEEQEEPQEAMPEIVKEALRKSLAKIAGDLVEILDQQAELKNKEDKLTREYQTIKQYMKE